VFSHEHNLLPFSPPQSYALLSVESKAADAANNKERLDVCHDMCGAVPFEKMSNIFSYGHLQFGVLFWVEMYQVTQD
jgi:hypothetical protein